MVLSIATDLWSKCNQNMQHVDFFSTSKLDWLCFRFSKLCYPVDRAKNSPEADSYWHLGPSMFVPFLGFWLFVDSLDDFAFALQGTKSTLEVLSLHRSCSVSVKTANWQTHIVNTIKQSQAHMIAFFSSQLVLPVNCSLVNWSSSEIEHWAASWTILTTKFKA